MSAFDVELMTVSIFNPLTKSQICKICYLLDEVDPTWMKIHDKFAIWYILKKTSTLCVASGATDNRLDLVILLDMSKLTIPTHRAVSLRLA